jgi:hypothetical protein
MPSDLDQALITLQDALSDAATVNNILLALRQNIARLAEPLRTVLLEARDAIDHVLPLLPAVAFSLGLLSP